MILNLQQQAILTLSGKRGLHACPILDHHVYTKYAISEWYQITNISMALYLHTEQFIEF